MRSNFGFEVNIFAWGENYIEGQKLFLMSNFCSRSIFNHEVNIYYNNLSSISTLEVNINYRIWSSNFIFEVKIHFSGQTFVSKSIFILKVKIYSWGQNLFLRVKFFRKKFFLEVNIYSRSQNLFLRSKLIFEVKFWFWGRIWF